MFLNSTAPGCTWCNTNSKCWRESVVKKGFDYSLKTPLADSHSGSCKLKPSFLLWTLLRLSCAVCLSSCYHRLPDWAIHLSISRCAAKTRLRSVLRVPQPSNTHTQNHANKTTKHREQLLKATVYVNVHTICILSNVPPRCDESELKKTVVKLILAP